MLTTTKIKWLFPGPSIRCLRARDGFIYRSPEEGLGGRAPDPTKPPYSTNSSSAYESGVWWPYIKTPRVYKYPTDKTNAPLWKLRNNKLSTYVMNDVVAARGRLLGKRPNTYKLGVFNPVAYVMWEPDERPPFGPNAYDDACNSPDPSDNGGVAGGTTEPSRWVSAGTWT